MPIATLTFSLPEETEEFNLANKGSTYYFVLQNIDEKCRGWLKYGHDIKTIDEALERIRAMCIIEE